MLNDNVPHSLAVWMGQSAQSAAQFACYFKDMEELASGCAIQCDLATNFIDSDWFLSHTTEGMASVPIEVLVQAVDCEPTTHAKILQAARAKGLFAGNAFFYHVDAHFDEPTPGRRYNGLLFLGNFADGPG